MKKLIPFLISGVLLAGAVGCQDATKTSSDTPSTTSESTTAPVKEASQTTDATAKDGADKTKTTDTAASDATKTAVKDGADKTKTTDTAAADATKTAVKDGADKTKTTDTAAADATKTAEKKSANGTADKAKTPAIGTVVNLKTSVITKLQEKFPGNKLEVDATKGAVLVKGTVAKAADLKLIESTVKQVKGVKTVKVEAKADDAKKPLN